MRFIVTSLALLFSAGLAISQTEKVDLRTLALTNGEFPELWVASSGKGVPLTFASSQPSAPLKAEKGSPLKIYKTAFDDKGKPTDASPTLVDLPATSILLLGWIEEEKPNFLAVADPFLTAKNDEWLVINQTKKPLTVQIGADAKPLTVEPGTQQPLKCTAPVGEGAAATVASKQEDGSTKTVYSSYLPIFADQRGLIVVVQSGERIKVNYISDPIASKKAGAKKR